MPNVPSVDVCCQIGQQVIFVEINLCLGQVVWFEINDLGFQVDELHNTGYSV